MSKETLDARYGNTRGGVYDFNPTPQMDSLRGFSVGNSVINSTTGEEFVCFDNTPNAARWRPKDLKVPTGIRMVLIGDSNISRNSMQSIANINGYNTWTRQSGPFSWLQALTNHPFRHIVSGANGWPLMGDNKGIAGDTTAGVLARLDRDVLSEPPQCVLMSIGSNDVAQDVPLETIKNNLSMIVSRILATGANLWLATIAPRNSGALPGPAYGYTLAQDNIRLDLNTWIRSLVSVYGTRIQILDMATIKTGSGPELLPPAYTYDGVHLNQAGAYYAAVNILLPAFKQMTGTQSVSRVIPAAYNVSTAPYGNILTNPEFTGTGGTKGSGTTGTLPDSWRSLRPVGTTVASAHSLIAGTDWNGAARTQIQTVLSSIGTGTDGEVIELRSYPAVSDTFTLGAEIGGTYEGEIEVTIDPVSSGVNNLRSVQVRIVDTTGDASSTASFYIADSADIADKVPNDTSPIKLVLRTPPLVCRGTTGFNFRVIFNLDGTVTGNRTVKVGAPVLKKVTKPVSDSSPTRKIHLRGVTGASFFVLPPRCYIDNIMFDNTSTANAITGGVKIGTTSGGADIVAALAVAGSTAVSTKPSDFLKAPFSMTAGQLIYFGAVTAWNSATPDIIVTFNEV